jgi:uncharacterized protein (TIGR02246 family)
VLQFLRVFQVLLLLSLSLTELSCRASEPMSSTSATQEVVSKEAAIRAEVAAVEAAWNKRDAAALAALYVPDGDAMMLATSRIIGQDAIRRAAEAGSIFPTDRTSTNQMSLTVDGIRYPSPEVAIVDGTARFSAGEPTRTRPTYIMVRRDGAWRIAALRVLPAEQQ